MTGPNANFSLMPQGVNEGYANRVDRQKAKEDEAGIPFASLIGQALNTVSQERENKDPANIDTDADLFDMAASKDANTSQIKVKLNKDTDANTSSVKQAGTKAVDTAKGTGALKQIAKDVEDEISDELDVSDEQIEAAMETLGLSYMDLINPTNLEGLITELQAQFSGESELLAQAIPQEAVMEMIPEIDDIIGEALNENGISLEEFSEFLTAASNEEIELPEDIKNLLPNALAQTDAADDLNSNGIQLTPNEPDGIAVNAPRTVTTAEQAVQVIRLTDDDFIDEDGELNEDALLGGEVAEDAALNMKNDDSSASSNDGQSQRNTGRDSLAHESATQPFDYGRADVGATVSGTQNVSFEQTIAQVEQVTSYTSQQTNDIINQIISRAATTITDTVSRMEMELNPQSLGRMIMQVQEQEGVVTARLIAQNESVREALETQLAQLRVSLEARGIKVDAVEVSVGTHEFEQALEEGMNNTAGEEAERENEAGRGRNRNLHRNELDEMDGELTEGEELAARIMRDNGGTVDYSA